jgi:ubiquinone/menaquinone biosynthesis C-methylase UbiE
MNLLNRLHFKSLLDVGGAEGYMCGLVKHLFGAHVRSCDLSAEAGRRARDLFGIQADAVDSVQLPYKDNSFDVVLCSEVLEHVPQYESVLNELLRIARTAVVLTVPNDPPHVIEKNIRMQIPHAHLHRFSHTHFDHLSKQGYHVESERYFTPHLLFLRVLLAAEKIESAQGFKSLALAPFNLLTPLLQKLSGKRAFAWFIALDRAIAQTSNKYHQVAFLITKASALATKQSTSIPVRAILDFKAPILKLTGSPSS